MSRYRRTVAADTVPTEATKNDRDHKVGSRDHKVGSRDRRCGNSDRNTRDEESLNWFATYDGESVGES